MFLKKTVFAFLILLLISSGISSQILKPEVLLKNISLNNEQRKAALSFLKEKTEKIQLNSKINKVLSSGNFVDSVYYVKAEGNKFRESYHYINGNVSSLLTEYHDRNNWIPGERYTREFDSEGNVILEMDEQWDSTAWVPLERQISVYDKEKNSVHIASDIWNAAESKWETEINLIREFDSNGNAVYEKFYGGIILMEMFLTYDPEGTLLNRTMAMYTDTVLNMKYRQTFKYDSNKNRSGALVEIWENDAWMVIEEQLLEYDNNNNVIINLLKYWNDEDSVWVNEMRRVYEYDLKNNNTQVIGEEWDDSAKVWYSYDRMTYEYDSNSNMLLELYQYRDNPGEWINSYHSIYKYDEKGELVNAVYEEWINDAWTKWDGYLSFDAPGNDDNFFYYTAWQIEKVIYITGTDVAENTEIVKKYTLSQNYPNPFNPYTNIAYSIPRSGHITLKVYSILGKEVMTLVNENQAAGEYTVGFNAGNLSSGVYIYRIDAGNYTSSKKLTLLR